MVDKLINRAGELDALQMRYASQKAEFLVIYGKRRVGKTALIKHFIKQHKNIYLLADKSNEKLQMEEFSAAVGRHFGDKFVRFSRWTAILKEMSLGKTRVNEIANAIGMERNALSKYLAVLENLRIIKKEVPVFEDMLKSRKGIYKIAEPYFNFWFRFIFPNKSKIELGEKEQLMKIINMELNVYVSRAFEDVCRQFIETWKNKPFEIGRIGSWWHKENKIDIICLNKKTGNAIFAECKWKKMLMGGRY